jgi:hypothetical protein
MREAEIEEIFTYHAPKGNQANDYETIRGRAKDFATCINDLCPESREKSLAITAIQQAVMWANAAKAIHE